jgi:hypothetical protein
LNALGIADQKQLDRRFTDKWLSIKELLAKSIDPPTDQTIQLARRFRDIWDCAPEKEQALRSTRDLIQSEGQPPFIFLKSHVQVEIEANGDAVIEFRRIAANVSSNAVRLYPGQLWFEHGQTADINLRGERSDGNEISFRIAEDYPNFKDYYSCFTPPIEPLQTVEYTVKYDAAAMFRSMHYWGTSYRQLTVSASVSIRQRTAKRLTGTRLEQITFDGEQVFLTPAIRGRTIDGLVSLDWSCEFPEPFSKYKICWDLDDYRK